MRNFFLKDIIVKTVKANAGFPSPAENYIEEDLDLNKYLIRNTEATFFTRVSGDSMMGIGIFNNDILIVDKSLNPVNQSIVVVAINGELVVKRLSRDVKSGIYFLKSENPNYPNLRLNSNFDVQVWGVVTYVIHCLLR